MNNLQKYVNNSTNYLLKMEVNMGRREYNQNNNLRRLVYVFTIALIVSIVIFLTVFTTYSRKLKNESRDSIEKLGKMNNIVPNNELEETSFSQDLSVSNTTNTINITNNQNAVNALKQDDKKISKEPINSIVTEEKSVPNNEVAETLSSEIAEDENEDEAKDEELVFIAPVSGEIIKDFEDNTLVYSNTLKEWTTHPGIDIKAEKTSIVVASEKGIVESIKNDPRYGLTITISHKDGFKTIYSNLLTSEFVNEGDEVEKGETIATIGDTASFEVADEAHLHFEMYKDGENVNPTIYLKDI